MIDIVVRPFRYHNVRALCSDTLKTATASTHAYSQRYVHTVFTFEAFCRSPRPFAAATAVVAPVAAAMAVVAGVATRRYDCRCDAVRRSVVFPLIVVYGHTTPAMHNNKCTPPPTATNAPSAFCFTQHCLLPPCIRPLFRVHVQRRSCPIRTTVRSTRCQRGHRRR